MPAVRIMTPARQIPGRVCANLSCVMASLDDHI